MTERTPRIILLGGPNGAGKTTVANRLLPDFVALRDYVNADTIASGLSAFAPESVAMEAGRIMLRRIRELADQRADFAFETTLASRTFAPFLRSCQANGYESSVAFLWLRSPGLALARVAARVRSGGHAVPDDVVRRRYRAGWRNFLDVYRPVVGSWQVYDNSNGLTILVAERAGAGAVRIVHPTTWSIIAAGPPRR